MTDLIGDASWYVGAGESGDYSEAASVVESGGLCPSRNAALRDAWRHGAPCLQVSDDLRKVEKPVWSGSRGKYVGEIIAFSEAVRCLLAMGDLHRARLCGVAPTPNPFYFNPSRAVTTRAFIVGDLCLLFPCDLWWDERLRLKEDYDMTLQHVRRYRRVARCNGILATFLHRQNAGGAVSYRTAELERRTIAYLKAKWPDRIRDNPRRPNEVLLRFG
jgi:hypothetical protein